MWIANTGFSFLNLDDRIVQIQLTDGTLNLPVQRLARNEVIEVDTPNQAFSITQPGQYRVEAGTDGNSSMVIVRQGQGEVTGGGRTYNLRSGQSGHIIPAQIHWTVTSLLPETRTTSTNGDSPATASMTDRNPLAMCHTT